MRKNHPTCEKSKELSYTITEEVINNFMEITWNMWNKFCPKGDENTIDTPLKEEIENHEVLHQLSQGDCREEHKEEGEDKLTILADGSCENQRESIDGCSQVYAGDIDIIFKNDFASQISHEHKY